MTYYVSYIFICLFAICISLVRFLTYALFNFFFLLLNFKNLLHISDNSVYQICLLKMFSTSIYFVFSFSWDSILQIEFLNF